MGSNLVVHRMNMLVLMRLGVGIRWDFDGGNFV
jgi:hypothetical protein